MLTANQQQVLLESMIESLELPDSAYETAKDRYEDLGEWLCRDESLCANHDPQISPQGSFRIGTAIRPLDATEEYDLDLVCELRRGISKASMSQESLKQLVGKELEGYRGYRHIKSPLAEKHRCWRLDYQDSLSFHMDILPCIPEEDQKRFLYESMVKLGMEGVLADSIAQAAISITDDRHPNYRMISGNWLISNPRGYAQWFESRMRQGACEDMFFAKAQVDDMPLYRRKTPLQRSIQVLKRHRDKMFKGNEDSKPISIIITTLASRAYNGEGDVRSALSTVLENMGDHVKNQFPRVQNPVNASEDFADRWSMPQYRHLQLERNFWNWLAQAQADFETLTLSDDAQFISNHLNERFALNMSMTSLKNKLGLNPASINIITPKKHIVSTTPARPWSKPW